MTERQIKNWVHLTLLQTKRELDWLVQNKDDANYYYKVGSAKGRIELLEVIKELLEEENVIN